MQLWNRHGIVPSDHFTNNIHALCKIYETSSWIIQNHFEFHQEFEIVWIPNEIQNNSKNTNYELLNLIKITILNYIRNFNITWHILVIPFSEVKLTKNTGSSIKNDVVIGVFSAYQIEFTFKRWKSQFFSITSHKGVPLTNRSMLFVCDELAICHMDMGIIPLVYRISLLDIYVEYIILAVIQCSVQHI